MATIDAMRWDGSALGAIPIINWVLAGDGTARYHGESDAPEAVTEIALDVPEGTVTVRPGDWIIRLAAGFYPCKPSDFAAMAYDETVDGDGNVVAVAANAIRDGKVGE